MFLFFKRNSGKRRQEKSHVGSEANEHLEASVPKQQARANSQLETACHQQSPTHLSLSSLSLSIPPNYVHPSSLSVCVSLALSLCLSLSLSHTEQIRVSLISFCDSPIQRSTSPDQDSTLPQLSIDPTFAPFGTVFRFFHFIFTYLTRCNSYFLYIYFVYISLSKRWYCSM